MFTEQQLKDLHKQCMIKLISKARSMDKTDKLYPNKIASIKNLFFDKIYWKRGFSYNPNTNLYTWVY